MNRKQKEETWSHPARWWRPGRDGLVECGLCPRGCRIPQGQFGFCAIRRNVDGNLVTLSYGRPTGFGVDPIEKKPLNHFLPGSSILSFGTAGCNLGCKFCQNWTTTKSRSDSVRSVPTTPDEVVRLALKEKCRSIAYTYNDPVIFGEYVIDICERAKEKGLRNVMVTAGYVTAGAREEIFRNVDAANVDLKSFSDSFYRKHSLAELAPVLDTLLWLRNETDVWIELTTLLIPGLNDSEKEIREECAWVREKLGPATPIHFTAFHPDFRMTNRPRTPHSTLRTARAAAFDEGLEYVYLGNVRDDDGASTKCPGCGTTLIERDWHSVRVNSLDGAACPGCGKVIPGVWK